MPICQHSTVIQACPGCGQRLRFPDDRGDLVVTCPVCRYSWEWTAPLTEDAIRDLLSYSLQHSFEQALNHFTMFRWEQVAALYQATLDTRRAMLLALLSRGLRTSTGSRSRRRRSASGEEASAWQENAIRQLEDGFPC